MCLLHPGNMPTGFWMQYSTAWGLLSSLHSLLHPLGFNSTNEIISAWRTALPLRNVYRSKTPNLLVLSLLPYMPPLEHFSKGKYSLSHLFHPSMLQFQLTVIFNSLWSCLAAAKYNRFLFFQQVRFKWVLSSEVSITTSGLQSLQ